MAAGVTVKLRHLLTWKFLFYEAALPWLRRLGPRRGDAILGGVGRGLARLRPGLRAEVVDRLGRAGVGRDVGATAFAVAANVPRYLARDYPLDLADDASALARFDLTGEAHLREALAAGRGAILVGSHFGAHVAGLHWLGRSGVPVRLLVQRPNHVSKSLRDRLDRGSAGPHPQASFFLKRGLSTPEAADRILRARAALRDGLAVYLNGDIPWPGANARVGRLLGQARPFLSVWADLAVLARSPALFVTCVHAPGGRYALDISPPIEVPPGGEPAAVAAYFARLDAAIAARPADAVAHLTWPCYGPGLPAMPCERAEARRAGARHRPRRG